jgi:hypothetical protein
VRYIATPAASKLTGLSTDKLREWTSRRALVPADVRAKRKGSPAKFSWQTILVLRIAGALRDGLHVELQSQRTFFADFRRSLQTTSFIALWGRTLILDGHGEWALIDDGKMLAADELYLVRLDPHLRAISAGFLMPSPAAVEGQLDLFSLPNVHGPRTPSTHQDLPSRRDAGSRRSA